MRRTKAERLRSTSTSGEPRTKASRLRWARISRGFGPNGRPSLIQRPVARIAVRQGRLAQYRVLVEDRTRLVGLIGRRQSYGPSLHAARGSGWGQAFGLVTVAHPRLPGLSRSV